MRSFAWLVFLGFKCVHVKQNINVTWTPFNTMSSFALYKHGCCLHDWLSSISLEDFIHLKASIPAIRFPLECERSEVRMWPDLNLSKKTHPEAIKNCCFRKPHMNFFRIEECMPERCMAHTLYLQPFSLGYRGGN